MLLNNITKTFSECCRQSVLPLLLYNIVGKFYKKKCSVIGGLNNIPKTFSKCFQNVFPLLSCNIVEMFYKKK